MNYPNGPSDLPEGPFILLRQGKKRRLFCSFAPFLPGGSPLQSYQRKEAAKKGRESMTARERILTLRLMEKMERNPGYAQKLGVSAVTKTAEVNALKRRREKNV